MRSFSNTHILNNSAQLSLSLRGSLIWLALTGVAIVLTALVLTQTHAQQRHQTLTNYVAAHAEYHLNHLNGHALPEDRVSQRLPVFHHLGNYSSLQDSVNWPANCDAPAVAPQAGRQFTASCSNGVVLYGLRLDASQMSGMSDSAWTWVLAHQDEFGYGINWMSVSVILAAFFAAALFAGSAMSRILTKPIRNIATEAMRIANGDLRHQINRSTLEELNPIVFALNQIGESLRDRERFLTKAAYEDPLTGLDNRTFLLHSLSERVQKAQEPLWIMTWSVGNIAEIHDSLGQELSEQVLRRVAHKARKISPGHLSLARIESNVFAIVMPYSLAQDKMESLLDRLMATKVSLEQHSIELQCNAGFSLFPMHGQDAETLIRRAELARQLAIKTRKPRLEFNHKMEKRSSDRLALVAELRRALNRHEFEMFLQPKYNLRSGKVTQGEALIRWNHPTRGLLGPYHFIELAEQTGFIKEISRWGLRDCYRIAETLRGDDFGVSFNVSALDLEDDALYEYAKELHREKPGITPLISLEITESSTINDPENACELLNKFAALGHKISVDDFGSGYSSLAYLKRFPVSELKIDRSLVQNADQNTDASIIVQSTVEMGHTMGLVVTVEGVETDGEYSLAKDLGADFIQGFCLSPPVPMDVFINRFVSVDQDQETHPT